MKQIMKITAGLLLIMAAGCSQNENGNKAVLKADDTTMNVEQQIEADRKEETLRYVAEDGSSALVTYVKSADGNSVSVRSNNKTINAPEKEVRGDETVYGAHDFEIISKGDSVKIIQGDNIILLKKARTN